MNNLKRLGALVLVMTLIASTTIYGAVEITVDITKNEPMIILSDEGERIFDIEYVFDVDFTHVTTGLDLVIVLDRSNSMLRPDPSTGLPVADAVWDAVNTFVTEVYNAYPKSNVAIVSFGTNGNKSDNWKYYDNLQDTLEEIEEVYDYRDLEENYHSNFRSYWNNGYRFAWENWQISDGATNISAAFDYGATTVDHKQTPGESSDQNVIILFTDGVATQGGSNSQKNYNYPTSHNSNTIAAYESGQLAQDAAEIITVGYFEGIEYDSTKSVARETLELSQNAGFFEATQTSHLTGIFDTIVDELNYIGTDATVVEIVEDEFEVVEGSIQPSSYELTVDGQGRQVITWQLGNVIDSDYTFGYKVKVKDEVYPTGSGSLEIPINEEAMLYYTDLNGLTVSESLGQSFTAIPPRNNQPLVNVDIVYENNQYGYLVGDAIVIDHGLSFINELPFDYREINVHSMVRENASDDLGSYVALSEESTSEGWILDEGQLTYLIDEIQNAGSGNLEWSKNIPITLKTIAVGNYQLSYNIDYVLTNSVGTEFDFNTMGNDPASVDVIEGTVVLDLTDNIGIAITEVEVYLNEVVAETELDENNDVVIKNVPTGTHDIRLISPSGYNLLTTGSSISTNSHQDILFEATLSYDAPTVTKALEFERLNVRDVMVSTRDDLHTKAIDTVDELVPSKVTFTLSRELTKVSLNMVDDFVGSDHVFTLDTIGGNTDVQNASGAVVGFEMNGNKLEYNGPALPVGTYTAYGIMTPPSLGEGLDYDYDVEVDAISTRESGDPSDTSMTMTSSGLLIEMVDDQAPVIVAVFDEEESTVNLINQDITITDKTEIVTYEIYNGTLTYEEILLETELHDFELVDDQGTSVLLDSDIQAVFSVDTPGQITASGSMTIYAVDAFGNYSVEVIEYENTEVNNLLDEDLV